MARAHTGLRLSQEAFDRLDAIAEEKGVSRSAVIRACLAVALKHSGDLNRILDSMKEA